MCEREWNVFSECGGTVYINKPTPKSIPCTFYLAKIKFLCLMSYDRPCQGERDRVTDLVRVKSIR